MYYLNIHSHCHIWLPESTLVLSERDSKAHQLVSKFNPFTAIFRNWSFVEFNQLLTLQRECYSTTTIFKNSSTPYMNM